MDMNRQGARTEDVVREIQGDVKEIEGDVKDIGGDVKEIKRYKGDMDRNSMCRILHEVYFSWLIMMVVDVNIQRTLKTIKDDQLGTYDFRFCPIF